MFNMKTSVKSILQWESPAEHHCRLSFTVLQDDIEYVVTQTALKEEVSFGRSIASDNCGEFDRTELIAKFQHSLSWHTEPSGNIVNIWNSRGHSYDAEAANRELHSVAICVRCAVHCEPQACLLACLLAGAKIRLGQLLASQQ